MQLRRLIQNQGEVPLTLIEGEQRTKTKTTLNSLDSLADYRVMINFKGKKSAFLLGMMSKNDIYNELAEKYIGREEVESSNINIHVQELNPDYSLI